MDDIASSAADQGGYPAEVPAEDRPERFNETGIPAQEQADPEVPTGTPAPREASGPMPDLGEPSVDAEETREPGGN